MAQYKRSLLWLRRDLRCYDHRAWAEAEKSSQELAVIFVFDSQILEKLKDSQDKRVTFIFKSLEEIQEKLQQRGSDLIIRYGNPLKEIPQVAQELRVNAVFCNRDHEPYAKKRDAQVESALKKAQISFNPFKDQVILEGQEVKKENGEAYRVFTPFSKAWRAKLHKEALEEAPVKLKNLLTQKVLKTLNQGLSFKTLNFQESSLIIEPGTIAALKSLKSFLKNIEAYKETRDYPAKRGGTSCLSPHLRFGTLSLRHLYRESLKSKSSGSTTWQNELIWREFYQALLELFPQLPDSCFQEKYNSLKWPGKESHFKAWCEGQTGYPIVDAAMRHFNRTGWMHNRLRMIVASFLTKDLLCHWKWGEAYFAEKLLDFDLASNNGGWQWAASVGCDAQPYFRIFNPTLQSERFDPEGAFIKEHIPELSKLPKELIHEPSKARPVDLASCEITLGKDYPLPLIDHKIQKDKAIALFKA